MNIGIDARTLKVKGGSYTYAFSLLKNLKNKKQIILFGVKNFKGYNCVDIKKNQNNPLYRLFFDFIGFSKLIKKNKIKLFHGLKGTIPLFTKCKKIITVHDIMVFSHPEFVVFKDKIYWKYFSPIYIKKADHIISVSKSTKKDLINYLNINEKDITVIPEAYNHKIFKKKINVIQRLEKYFGDKIKDLKNKKIILNVNTIQPRKNIQGLIKAFNIIAKIDKKVILIISGGEGWKTKKIYQEYKLSKYKNRIYFIGYTPDKILADLYNFAKVFVYPSFYEGFGLPIIEAQACGCPIITSNTSSMPEVIGDSAILINPKDIKGISKAILQILKNPNLRKKLIKKGFNNITRFSWKKNAEETQKIYNKLLNND